jgi:hypothetical protein
METRTLAVLLFAVLLVALSVYAAVADTGVKSARGNSLNIGDVSAAATQAHGVPHRLAAGVDDEAERANDKESGQNIDFDGELGLQMSRGAGSLSTTGSFTSEAGPSSDREEELEL